jgi:hypothetical protein
MVDEFVDSSLRQPLLCWHIYLCVTVDVVVLDTLQLVVATWAIIVHRGRLSFHVSHLISQLVAISIICSDFTER